MSRPTKLPSPDILDADGNLRDPYRGFIAVSKYARWLDDKGRRETWKETVDRYVDYMVHYQRKRGVKISNSTVEDVRHAITYHHVMPSMRALMTAGPALDKNHIASYNCSFIAVDSIRAFDEALVVLMHGTGLGFSVEAKHINKLPEVGETFHKTDTTVRVEDSKEGWAKSLKDYLSLLWAGQIPKYDVSAVRPKGARLKTFGGRASGPEPLVDLFEFTKEILIKASGRKLTSLEVHDIMCKIGEIVVVGGVRRSALISLSDLGDREMAEAKAGAWWVNDSQRALANNSATYYSRPKMEVFFREWKNLYDSKSGERGIVNLDASRRQAERIGRRDTKQLEGTNPSLIAGTRVYTTEGIKNIEDLENKDFKVRNLNGAISDAYCWKSGVDEDVLKVTIRGGHSYTATPQHKWPVWDGEGWTKKRTDELNKGDRLPNLVRSEMYPEGTQGTYDQGFLIGWNLGDGWITSRPEGIQIGFIVGPEDRDHGIDTKLEAILSDLGSSANFAGKDEINVNNKAVRQLFSDFDVRHKTEGLPKSVWDSEVSDDFRRGIIDGLFSADGGVDSTRINLTQASEKMIRDVSSLLGFFGVKTNIHTQETTSGKAFPEKYSEDSKDKKFTAWRLRVGEVHNIKIFTDNFALSHSRKQQDIRAILDKDAAKTYEGVGSYRRKSKSWYVEVDSITTAGTADVWDVTVHDDTHAFQLDHCVTGNCGEIILRNKGVCNLTEVVVQADDTLDTLKEKVRLATILGTWQASLTNFKYLRRKWRENAEEEALLGVSLTGIFGNSLLSGNEGLDKLASVLEEMKALAVKVNETTAKEIGINPAAAITCVKPSGTVSQLTGVSSGIHPWYSQRYVRRVRGNNSDPLTRLMKDLGVPNEPELNKPDDTTVFEFPLEAPEGALLQEDLSALDHLKLWITYRNHWTEHNPSITVTVEEHEWLEVGAFVYKNFDDMSGVSFLPGAGNHTYQQAPFESLDEEEFNSLKEKSVSISWRELSHYEHEDGTTSSQELACVAGACEVVGLDEASETERKVVPDIDLSKLVLSTSR